jgi:hypothetical protein
MHAVHTVIYIYIYIFPLDLLREVGVHPDWGPCIGGFHVVLSLISFCYFPLSPLPFPVSSLSSSFLVLLHAEHIPHHFHFCHTILILGLAKSVHGSHNSSSSRSIYFFGIKIQYIYMKLLPTSGDLF